MSDSRPTGGVTRTLTAAEVDDLVRACSETPMGVGWFDALKLAATVRARDEDIARLRQELDDNNARWHDHANGLAMIALGVEPPPVWNYSIENHDLRPGDWVLWRSEHRGLCRGRVAMIWGYGLLDVDEETGREVPVARTDVVAVWRPPGPPEMPEVIP